MCAALCLSSIAAGGFILAAGDGALHTERSTSESAAAARPSSSMPTAAFDARDWHPIVYSAPSDTSSWLAADPSASSRGTSLPSWIINGQLCATCAWPATAEMGNGNCTGTLIHPKVITTAAHCGPQKGQKFTFGESTAQVTATATKCVAGASGSSGANTKNDWAYCVLDKEVAGVPYVPPLVGCEADKFLKPGVKIWLVGYGITSPSGSGGGVKREVEVPVNKVADGIVDVGLANGTGACHGDSGGPAYIHLVDGSNDYGWRVFGSTSGPGSSNCDCTCTTIYVNIANHVKAIEANENIDVTPCTDATGKWEGGPNCKDFPADPQKSGGSWPTCNNKMTSGLLTTCGPNGGGGAAGAGGGDGGAGAAGAAGKGGGGGTAGSAGAAGNGGMSGGAGTGGTAGMAGTAGSGGNAGASGSAGKSGAAGSGVAGSGNGGSGNGGTSGAGGAAGSYGGGGLGGMAGAGAGAGAAGSGGAGGIAGRSGTSGAAGAGGSRTSDAGSTTSRPYSDPEPGCACRMIAHPRSAPAVYYAGLLAALAAIARRRSRR